MKGLLNEKTNSIFRIYFFHLYVPLLYFDRRAE
jgi:hypothetical protein